MVTGLTALLAGAWLWVSLAGCGGRGAEAIKILTFGDSITQGERPGVTPSQTFTAVLGKMLQAKGIQVQMIREGVSGENTRGGWDRIQGVIDRWSPHCVTIMYGTNDAFFDVHRDPKDTTPRIPVEDYEQRLRAMARLLRGKGIRVILMTPIPMGHFDLLEIGIYKGRDRNFKLKEYAEAVRRVAAAENLFVVDHFKKWLEWERAGTNLNRRLTDGIHPNPDGHRVIAKTIFPVIHKALRDFAN